MQLELYNLKQTSSFCGCEYRLFIQYVRTKRISQPYIVYGSRQNFYKKEDLPFLKREVENIQLKNKQYFKKFNAKRSYKNGKRDRNS